MKIGAFLLIVVGMSAGTVTYLSMEPAQAKLSFVQLEPEQTVKPTKPTKLVEIATAAKHVKRGMTVQEVSGLLVCQGVETFRAGDTSTVVWVGQDATLFCNTINGVVMDYTLLGTQRESPCVGHVGATCSS
jgi:hypothetical protein